MEPNSREFYKQCAFQKFCNTVLHNEASLICYVLINFASYEQIDNCPKKGHKKIPPNLKTNSEGNLGYNKITHPNIVFYLVSLFFQIRNKKSR